MYASFHIQIWEREDRSLSPAIVKERTTEVNYCPPEHCHHTRVKNSLSNDLTSLTPLGSFLSVWKYIAVSVTVTFCGIPFYFTVRCYRICQILVSVLWPCLWCFWKLLCLIFFQLLERREGTTSSWELYLHCHIESKMVTTVEMSKYPLRELFWG